MNFSNQNTKLFNNLIDVLFKINIRCEFINDQIMDFDFSIMALGDEADSAADYFASIRGGGLSDADRTDTIDLLQRGLLVADPFLGRRISAVIAALEVQHTAQAEAA